MHLTNSDINLNRCTEVTNASCTLSYNAESMLSTQPNNDNKNTVSQLKDSLQNDGRMSFKTNSESQDVVPSAINHTLLTDNAKHKYNTDISMCPTGNNFAPPAISTSAANTFNEGMADMISSATSTTTSICTTGTSHTN